MNQFLFIFLIYFLIYLLHLHLCAFNMRMATLLFADENAPEWAFSKRKGVKTCSNMGI